MDGNGPSPAISGRRRRGLPRVGRECRGLQPYHVAGGCAAGLVARAGGPDLVGWANCSPDPDPGPRPRRRHNGGLGWLGRPAVGARQYCPLLAGLLPGAGCCGVAERWLHCPGLHPGWGGGAQGEAV
ncbi:MAG: hypothetical protein QW186_08685 [Candidatus Bathyarchaeia archaeon]